MSASPRWEALWSQGINQGDNFDASAPLPALVHALQTSSLPKATRALVPGCGRAYAVRALAESNNYESVTGLELSQTAVSAAKEYLESHNVPNYQIIQGDFYSEEHLSGQFGLIYDYTFFCAMPLDIRPKWAQRMMQLVAKGGILVTAMYPMFKLPEEGGPPFGVSVEIYRELLEKDGAFKCVDGPRMLPDELCHSRRTKRTCWAQWQRQ